MDYLAAATALSVLAVTFVTQALKYIPVAWTTKFAVYINIVLSIVAVLIANGGVPAFNGDWGSFLGQLLTVVLGAALTYELIVRPAVTKPKGNLPEQR